MKFLIDNFGVLNLFGLDNYEYYARISGHILKVEDNWIFAFKYPPDTLLPLYLFKQQREPGSPISCQQAVQLHNLDQDELHHHSLQPHQLPSHIEQLEEEDDDLDHHSIARRFHRLNDMVATDADVSTLDELRAVNLYAELTKSLTFLPIIHERQTQRMRTRSEWFLEGPRPN